MPGRLSRLRRTGSGGRAVAGAAFLGLLAGCSGAEPAPVGGAATASPAGAGLPCPDPTLFGLGSPYRTGPVARFVAAGGPVAVTARRFEHGGVLDPPRGRTQVWVGDGEADPVFDEASGAVRGGVASVSVAEGSWVQLDLTPGEHWLWSSTGGDVQLASCSATGVTLVRKVD